MWSAPGPVVPERMTRNLGPVGKLEAAAEGAGEIGRLAGDLPRLLMRGASLLEHLHHRAHGGVTLSSETIAELTKAEARHNRWGVLAQWAIALMLLWIVI